MAQDRSSWYSRESPMSISELLETDDDGDNWFMMQKNSLENLAMRQQYCAQLLSTPISRDVRDEINSIKTQLAA